VVCNAFTLLPWCISVIAKQPGNAKVAMSFTYLSWCVLVPNEATLPPNKPKWTPNFIVKLKSYLAISSKTAA